MDAGRQPQVVFPYVLDKASSKSSFPVLQPPAKICNKAGSQGEISDSHVPLQKDFFLCIAKSENIYFMLHIHYNGNTKGFTELCI